MPPRRSLDRSRAALARVRKVPRSASQARLAARDPLAFLQALVAEQGDVARFPLGLRRELVVVAHPEAVHEVLVARNAAFRGLRLAMPLLDEGLLSVDGEEHRRQRAQLKGSFHHERIRAYAALASASAARWGGAWRDAGTVDMAEEMMRLTLEVTGQAVFGPDHARQAAEVGQALTECLEAFRRSPLAPWTSRLPTPTGARFRLARARLDAKVGAMLEERRALPQLRHDMLAMLLDAADPAGARMDDKALRDQLVTLLVAGHETTALWMTWTWHALARNPAVQARLHAEVDGVLQGRLPGVEDAGRLPYARLVLSEALRDNPPVWAIGRKAAEAVEVGGQPVRAGSIVVVSPFLTQHDPRWWPEPDRFDPERFAPEAAKARPRYAWFPFGGGPRVCLGEQLAWLEATLMLATLAQRWAVEPAGDAVRRQPLLTLQPRGGLPLKVRARRA